MSSSLRVAVLTLTVAVGLIAAGCGGSASSLSPTGPSVGAGISSSASTLSDTGIVGTEKQGGEHGNGEHGNGHGNGEHGDGEKEHGGGDRERDFEHGPPNGNGVQVNGRITAIDAAARTFNVGTAKVNVPLTATIRHGNRRFLFTDLSLGDHVQVKGSKNDAGVVVAAEVKVEQGGNDEDDDEDDDDHLNRAEAEGAVSALTGTCPALTFNVLTTKVTTTATTMFRGITCAALANGAVVEVKGTKQPDGSIVAARVSVDTDVRGAVSALTGTCPALTFNVLTTKVTTSATTMFHEITCAAIANGTLVEVEGTKQVDGSITATRVSRED